MGWSLLLCGAVAAATACDNKKDAPQPALAAAPSAATPEDTSARRAPPPPRPAAPAAPAAGGLTAGKHACMMIDGTGSYNRVCTVAAQPDGSLSVKAPGTGLNPKNGFEFRATGGPSSYQLDGKMTAFDSCTGAFKAAAAEEKVGGAPWYVARFAPQGKGAERCKIMIRVPALAAPSSGAQCTGDGADSELPCTLKDGRWGWCKGGACKDICPPGYSYHPNDTRCHQRRDCKPGGGEGVKTAQCNMCYGEHCFDDAASKDMR
jgi:hypothetical protein